MAISQQAYFGRGFGDGLFANDHDHSYRLMFFAGETSTDDFILPAARPDKIGRCFVFCNTHASEALPVVDDGGTTVYTITAGDCVEMYLLSAGDADGEWHGLDKGAYSI